MPFRKVEMPKSHLQCGRRRLFGRERIGDQRAESDRRDRTRTVGERDPRIAKRIRVRHCSCSSFDRPSACGQISATSAHSVRSAPAAMRTDRCLRTSAGLATRPPMTIAQSHPFFAISSVANRDLALVAKISRSAAVDALADDVCRRVCDHDRGWVRANQAVAGSGGVGRKRPPDRAQRVSPSNQSVAYSLQLIAYESCWANRDQTAAVFAAQTDAVGAQSIRHYFTSNINRALQNL